MTQDEALEFIRSDKAIAHYTSYSVALENILSSLQLRASSLDKLNDPRESLERYIGICYQGSNHEYSIEVMRRLEYMRFKMPKVLSFCMSDPNEVMDELGKCYSLPNMWAYYGGKHTGMCLVFDREELLSSLGEIRLAFAGRISYEHVISGAHRIGSFGSLSEIDEKFKGDVDRFVISHLEEVVYPLLGKKDYNWQAEQEYRVVLSTDDVDYSFIDVKSCLKSIVLGQNFPSVYLQSLLRLLPPNISVFRSIWNDQYDTPGIEWVHRS